MKTALKVGLIAFALTCSPAQAAPSFEKKYNSGRIQAVEYSDNLVVKVVGYQNHSTVIEFTKGETLETIHGAAPINWIGAAVENKAFIRPENNAKTGTIIITTDKHSYILDLVPAYGKTNSTDRVSKIIFTKASGKTTKSTEPIKPEVKRGFAPKVKNINYTMEIVNNETDIIPLEVYDDGTFTYFKFPFHSEIPAIYKGSLGSKKETTVNTHNENDYVVVQGVSSQWNLRSGDALIGVFNETFSNEGSHVK